MTTYVLDAAAGADLLLDTAPGRAMAAQFEADAAWWVPDHYFLEVASVLRRAELKGMITPAKATSAIHGLGVAPLRRAQVRQLLVESWALRGHLTLYDAPYVVLAAHLGATLVTSDLRLARSPGLKLPTITPEQPG